jgi:hypothetical protein
MNAAEALQETPADADARAAARQGANLGNRVAGLLERLHNHPTDRALARAVRLTLDHLATEAGDQANQL